MFAEWVTEGAAFGIKAFFAMVVFVAFCATIVGLLELFSNVVKGADDGKTKHHPD